MQAQRVRVVHKRFEELLERRVRLALGFERSGEREPCPPLLRIVDDELAAKLSKTFGRAELLITHRQTVEGEVCAFRRALDDLLPNPDCLEQFFVARVDVPEDQICRYHARIE